jgi:hypothetical protein
MPSDSDAAQAKKARKKPKAPQKIDKAVWLEIEKAVLAGLGYSEAGRKFGVSVFAIMARARRNHWPVGSRIQRRVEALQEARYKAREHYKPYEETRNGNEEVIQAVAESWAEKGEAHRSLVHGITTAALKKIAHAPPPIENWADVERADKADRRSCGLDDSERNQTINIGMQMVEARLLSLELPRDALPGMPGSEPQSPVGSSKTPRNALR